MTQPWFWKKIWDKMDDFEYEADLRVLRALQDVSRKGGKITDGMVAFLASATGHSAQVCDESFKRLICFGSLKRTRYAGPGESTYRISTAKGGRPRRAPLGGKRFRPPTRPDGSGWGRPVGSASVPRASFTGVVAEMPTAYVIDRSRPAHVRKVGVASAPRSGEPGAFDVYRFLAGLHPSVRDFCECLMEGRNIDDAASEAGLTPEQTALVLPKLQNALSFLTNA